MSSLFYYYFFPYIMSCRRNMQGVTSYDNIDTVAIGLMVVEGAYREWESLWKI